MGRGSSRSKNKNRKIERRRRTRKYAQRGGAAANIQEWIAAVVQKFNDIASDSRFVKNDTNTLGSYHFSDLKDDKLRLPDMDKLDPQFDIDSGRGKVIRDLRSEWKKLVEEYMGHIIEADPMPDQFKMYIEKSVAPSVGTDNSITLAVKYTIDLENKLRSFTEKQKIASLGDSEEYPLFIWALMMNPPLKPVDLLPSEVPEDEVKDELRRFSETSSEAIADPDSIPA